MPGEGDFALRLALVVAAVLGAFSLLLMLQILVVAQAGARRSQRREIFRETWRPLLAAESLGMASQSPPQSPRRDDERRWWLQLWSQMQATLRGEREYDIEVRIVRPDGTVRFRPFACTGGAG